ncbi:sugar ABC transporter permease [Gryllotalpicola daejeonensis]|uniref:Sugar ABC transporter permease n=1 Tax=Gryllotalpicola daejeonensis TaxID=993087 RepID=A0ABP7ZM11_9MICO
MTSTPTPASAPTAQASAVVSDAPAAASRSHAVVTGGARRRRLAADTATHVFLGVLAVFWLIPIVWIFMESFNKNTLPFTTTFFPTQYTLSNYVKLFTDTSVMNFPQMFVRTLVIAIFVCAIQLIFVLSVGFVMSRLRFRLRRPFMNTALVLGMFPGIMAVVAIYFILKALGLTGSSTATSVGLILVYSAGSGAGFYVMKGFMDTIPVSMDEAAVLDGCTRWQVFTRIILPITKPMMVYQAIVGFLTPWLDFVLAKAIARTQGNYTVSLGLWQMLQKEYIAEWYTRFAAGAVLISIPIAILFIIMQRFYQSSMTGSVKG